MQCPRCWHENPAEANFCLNCGNRLAKVCPQCQQVLPPEANYCMACGHNLTATPQPDQPDVTPEAQSIQTQSAPPEPPTPEAERRQLTVTFCDLADSTYTYGGNSEHRTMRRCLQMGEETAKEKKLIGEVTHFFGKISVAAIELSDVIKVGDTI